MFLVFDERFIMYALKFLMFFFISYMSLPMFMVYSFCAYLHLLWFLSIIFCISMDFAACWIHMFTKMVLCRRLGERGLVRPNAADRRHQSEAGVVRCLLCARWSGRFSLAHWAHYLSFWRTTGEAKPADPGSCTHWRRTCLPHSGDSPAFPNFTCNLRAFG